MPEEPMVGMKWSDGAPFTANDFLFWYEEVYFNKDLVPVPHPDIMANGDFQDSNFLFVDILAGSTAIEGGQATQAMGGRSMGAYMPAHYIKQFLPKFFSKDEVDKKGPTS